MSILISLASAALFGAGFYLMLNRGLLNRVLGILLISHGANFILLTMAGLKLFPKPPILNEGSLHSLADPLPQALILTALVIGFGIAAFLWALVLRLGKDETP